MCCFINPKIEFFESLKCKVRNTKTINQLLQNRKINEKARERKKQTILTFN